MPRGCSARLTARPRNSGEQPMNSRPLRPAADDRPPIARPRTTVDGVDSHAGRPCTAPDAAFDEPRSPRIPGSRWPISGAPACTRSTWKAPRRGPRRPRARELAAAASPRERQPYRDHCAGGDRGASARSAMTGRRNSISTDIRAMRWCCRCCSAPSGSTRSPARADHDAARAHALRALCAALWRRLVVPDLSRLVEDRGRQSLLRPRRDRAGYGAEAGKRQRRAWPSRMRCSSRATWR